MQLLSCPFRSSHVNSSSPMRSLKPLFLIFLMFGCQRETVVERANRDGLFLSGNGAEPKALDPQLVTGVPESKIITALFEGLVADHPTDDAAAPPGAALSWTHNTDFTEWTFKLRPDGKWSDGEPVTAHDFVFAYQRMLSPGLIAPYSEMLYFIDNAEPFNRGEIDDFGEVGVEAVDDLTIHLRLKEPVPFLPSLTRHYTWFPVPRHVILRHGKIDERFTDWSELGHIVGNGPFRLTKWRFHDVIEAEKNPHYWDHQNVALNGIHFFPIENSYTETRAFLAGQLHTTYRLPTDLIRSVKEQHPEFLRQEPYVGTTFLRINTTRKGLNDARVRRALALAIDRQELTDYIQEGYDPAVSFTPRMGDYKPQAALSFDPEKARILLESAGYPKGRGFPRFTLLTSSPDSRPIAEAFQAKWREELGILVDIRTLDWGSYNTVQQQLKYDMALAGWIGDYLDPTTFLNLWTASNGNNKTGWASPKYEALLAEAAQKSTPSERYALMRDAETLLMEELPIVPFSHYARNYLLRPEVKGWSPLLLDNHPWKDISLEP